MIVSLTLLTLLEACAQQSSAELHPPTSPHPVDCSSMPDLGSLAGPMTAESIAHWAQEAQRLITCHMMAPPAPPTPMCVNPTLPDCEFYTKCVEATCKCGFSSSSGYALSYGKKYCELFKGETNFSAQGKKWRDSTLRCLQEKLVSELPTSPDRCDCADLQQKAFRSHVECYTRSEASICDLPISDAVVLNRLIDNSNKFDTEGIRAISGVGKVCLLQSAKDMTNPALWAWPAAISPDRAAANFWKNPPLWALWPAATPAAEANFWMQLVKAAKQRSGAQAAPER